MGIYGVKRIVTAERLDVGDDGPVYLSTRDEHGEVVRQVRLEPAELDALGPHLSGGETGTGWAVVGSNERISMAVCYVAAADPAESSMAVAGAIARQVAAAFAMGGGGFAYAVVRARGCIALEKGDTNVPDRSAP